MNLLRVSLQTGMAAAIRAVFGFIATKIIALYVGPGGLAQIGHFANFSSIATALAGGGVSVGVTKYVAEQRAPGQPGSPILGTALALALSCSFVLSCVLLLWRQELSLWLFGSPAYSGILAAFAAVLAPAALNGLLLAILAGHRKVRNVVMLNVAASFASLLLTASMTIYAGLQGALLALALAQLSAFLLSLRFGGWSALRGIHPLFERKSLFLLARYSAMAVVSAISLPLALMIVRNHLGETISWEAAGYWQGVWKISEAYLLLVTASFGVYYLPRLSEIREPALLKREILHGYSVLLPIAALSAACIYLLREPLTRFLFSDAFLPMTELFAFQLAGDVLKVGSWMIAHLMLAKAMTVSFIASEVLFAACFVILSLLLTARFGTVGASYAFALSYLFYWAGMG
ncbi:MAG: O-antigen translocase, partial [Sulfuricella denitrificans]|nr:O-antigen translocase [Sulfuricella denitrificans]